jgi:RNA polymerase sigma-70 factor (ECF subfamily)
MPSDAKPNDSALSTTEPVRSRLDGVARRYYAPLASFFRKRTRNAAEVQDLVQQVFLRLAQSREMAEIRNPDAYIFQTAANTLRDHYRQTAVRTRYLNESLATTDAAPSEFSTEHVMLARENLERLVVALRQLPERTRDVLMLRRFEGLKNAEIARLHNISLRSVEKHIAKAMALLSYALDREGGD